MNSTFRGWFPAFLALSFVSAYSVLGAYAQSFTPGNLVVSRIGDGGSSPLTTGGNAVYLDEYKPMPGQTTSVTTKALNIYADALDTTEGKLTRSVTGNALTSAGYQSAITGNNVTFTSSSTDPRTIAAVDPTRTVTATTLGASYSAKPVYSTISPDGKSFYAGGSSTSGSGIQFVSSSGAAPIQVGGSPNIKAGAFSSYGGNLYFSGAANGSTGIFQLSPSLNDTPKTLLITGNGSQPQDFFFANASTLYVADSRVVSGINTTGGIQKYTMSNGSFSYDYTLTNGLVGNTPTSSTIYGVDGLAGALSVDGSSVSLYGTDANDGLNAMGNAITGGNHLVSIMDVLGATTLPAGEQFTTLATASANTVFRGVAFAPSNLSPAPAPPGIVSAGIGLALAGIGNLRRRKSKP